MAYYQWPKVCVAIVCECVCGLVSVGVHSFI